MSFPDPDNKPRKVPALFGAAASQRDNSVRLTLATMFVCWLLLLFILYQVYGWWQSRPPAAPAVPQSAAAAQPEASQALAQQPDPPGNKPPAKVNAQQRLPGASPRPSPNLHSFTKCEVNRRVIFTDRECPAGAKESTVTVKTTPAPAH